VIIFDIPDKEKELDSLREKSSQPDFWNNNQRAREVTQRMARLEEDVSNYHQIHGQLEDLKELVELAIEEEDESINDEINAEVETVKEELGELEFKLMMDGEHAQNNAILSIHPGAGGTEAQDWAHMLYRMYMRWCEQHGFKMEEFDFVSGDEAGIKSVAMLVAGNYAYGYLQAESGIHRLVRLSPFDFNHRRHTSCAAVSVSPEIDDTIKVDINDDDLRINTFRSGGPGGQSVNKTDSAVRITHIPTGIVVQCQNERSQYRNKEVAMKVLRSRLYDYYRQRQNEEIAKLKGEKLNINFGSQIRSYVFHPYRLVRDERTSVETSNVDAVMDGDLDMFIEAFLKKK